MLSLHRSIIGLFILVIPSIIQKPYIYLKKNLFCVVHANFSSHCDIKKLEYDTIQFKNCELVFLLQISFPIFSKWKGILQKVYNVGLVKLLTGNFQA